MGHTRIAIIVLLLAGGLLGMYWVATAQEGPVPWPPPPVRVDEAEPESPSDPRSPPAKPAVLPASRDSKTPSAEKDKKTSLRKWFSGILPVAAQEPSKGRSTSTLQLADGRVGPDVPPPTPPKVSVPAPMPRAAETESAVGPGLPMGATPPNSAPPLPVATTPAITPLGSAASRASDPLQPAPLPSTVPGPAGIPAVALPGPPETVPGSGQPLPLPGSAAKAPAFVLVKTKPKAETRAAVISPAPVAAVPPLTPGAPAYSPAAPAAPTAPAAPPITPLAPIGTSPAAVQRVSADASASPDGGPALLAVQTPALTVEKRGPAQSRASEPLTFQLTVRNLGNVPAHQVRIDDVLPADAQVIGADPTPHLDGNHAIWLLSEIPAGASRVISVMLRTAAPGPLTHSTRVNVIGEASAATSLAVVAPPPNSLIVQVSGPASVAVGQPAAFEVTYSNRGPHPLANLLLRAVLSDGLRHPVGQSIEADVGNLEPGATKTIKVTATAALPGRQGLQVRLTGPGDAQGVGQALLDVVTAKAGLGVHQAPVTRLYVGRVGDLRVEVTNHSSTPMRHVAVVSYLPEAVDFVAATDQGNYQPNARTVNWLLDPLAPGETHAFLLRVQANASGQLPYGVAVRADGVSEIKSAAALAIEGIADLGIALQGDEALEAGKETVYEIRVANPGSAPNSNVRVEVALAPGLLPRSAQGPSPFRIDGQSVIFEGLSVLVPQGQAIYRVSAVGNTAGDGRIRVGVSSDQVRTPVMREKVTRVYRD